MTAATDATTDRGLGLALALGALSVLAALGMFAAAPTPYAGVAFAVAMTFGALVIAAIHLYWP